MFYQMGASHRTLLLAATAKDVAAFVRFATESSSTLCFSLLPTLSGCSCSLCSRASRLSSRIRGRTIHGLLLREVDRNGDAHFCPCTCPAPDTESRADIFRAFP